jgi:hypothetical protein
MARYPALAESLKSQLAAIEPSRSGKLDYYPCQVLPRTGATMDRVYVAAEAPYISVWGVYPEQDRGKSSIDIADIVSIKESPSRLPARFANRLYEAGESGMGYQVFTVVFSDGTNQPYFTGGAVDFIKYPAGKGMKDVADVLPHVGRDQNPERAPKYYWCLYSDGDVSVHMRPMPVEHRTLKSSVRYLWRRFSGTFLRP